MTMGTCSICGKTERIANVGSGDICAKCAEKPCPACGVAIAKSERRTVIMDVRTATLGIVKRRVHAPIDPQHSRFVETQRALIQTPQPILTPPRLVVAEQQAVAP